MDGPVSGEVRPVFSAGPASRSLFLTPGDLDGKTLVVFKLSGWGTLVSVAPLLAGIRRRFPAMRQVLVTGEKNVRIASRFFFCNEILTVENTAGRSGLPFWEAMGLALRIRSFRPSLFLDLQLHSFRKTALYLSRSSGAGARIGFVSHSDRPRMHHLTHPLFFNSHHPSLLAYEQAARLFGVETESSRKEVMESLFREDPEEGSKVEALCPFLTLSGKLCVINPNASERASERRWPPEYFAAAVDRLLRRHPALRIVMTGGGEEREYVEGICRKSGAPASRLFNMAGKLPFGGFIALLRRAHVFLTNDSGPLHLAVALGTPTVALFGPTRPDLVLPHADPGRLAALYDPLYCSPCLYQIDRPPCGGNNVCLSGVSVDRVVRAVESFLPGENALPELRPVLFHTSRRRTTFGDPMAGFYGGGAGEVP